MAAIRIDAEQVTPAKVEGDSQNVFRASKFVLMKPKWQSDESASACGLCKSKFNQIRRRHHCRTCGRVLCAKCCSNKVPVPQFQMDSLERVCNGCMPVVTCVTMSHSEEQEFLCRAVSSFEIICRDNPASVLALGGAQTLVYLARKMSGCQMKTLGQITTCLHTLCLHSGALLWYSEIGFIDALTHILQISSSVQDQSGMISEALDTLRIFSKTSDSLKRKAVQCGCIAPLLHLGQSDNPFISLVSMTTLGLIAECSATHNAILSQKNALRDLLSRVNSSKDDKDVEIVLRMIMLMSAGNQETKHRIVCEDSSVGAAISQVIKKWPSHPQILANAACAIANLATSCDDQVTLQNSVIVLLQALSQNLPGYVSVHCIRALANFAKYELHANALLSNFPIIMQLLNSSYGPLINSHALRCIFNVLQQRAVDASKAIQRCGSQELILRLAERESVMRDLLASMDRVAPSIATE